MALKTYPKRCTGQRTWSSGPGVINPGTPVNTGSSGQKYSWNDSFDGVEVSRYREKIKAGEPATSLALGLEQRNRFPTVQAYKKSIVHGWASLVGTADLGPPWADYLGSFDYTKADSSARIKFVSDYRSTRQGFSAGTFLGELKETLRMVRSPLLALRQKLDNYYGAVKERTRRNKKSSWSKVASSTWLEYQFGMRPLANDVADALVILHNLRPFYLKRISGFGKDGGPRGRVAQSGTGFGPISFELLYEKKEEVSVRYIGAVRADRHPTPAWHETWGFRVQDFVPTVWELIPYSFLVDYFTNIGDVLSAASEGTVELAWGCKTSRGVRSVSLIGAADTSAASHSGAVHVDKGEFSSFKEFSRREVLKVQVGVNDVGFRIPGFQSKKWLNIGALARLRS